MKKSPLTLGEYNRIHQITRGVLRNVVEAERSCISFATFGAYVLQEHYQIPALPVAGNFGLCVGEGPSLILFGKGDHGRIVSESDGFHMWVQTPTHIIDFMAPIFREAAGTLLGGTVVPRKMLQRQISTQATSPNRVKTTGDFFTLPDPKLTKRLLANFVSVPANQDLLMIADEWFASSHLKQQQTFAMTNELGEVYRLSLPNSVATGAW